MTISKCPSMRFQGDFQYTPRSFHRDRPTLRRFQPVNTGEQVSSHRGKVAKLFVLTASFIDDEQTRHEELFVDINPTTASIQNFHEGSSL
jgi:hypothetical protein